MIDLHIHTTKSDGELSPKEVVELAKKQGLKAIAITDHDTAEGVVVHDPDIEIIPGIEARATVKGTEFKEIDVIGLFIDINNAALLSMVEKARSVRISQKKQIIKKLQKLGFKITFKEVKKYVEVSFGRPHIAKFLLKKYPSEFTSVDDVFAKYLGNGKPAYVGRGTSTDLKEVIEAIHKAGGIAFLAHPGVFGKDNSVKLIGVFKKYGGDGIETYYPYHKICPELGFNEKQNLELVRFYQDISKELSLIESGGSDFHGATRPPKLGEMDVPYSVLKKMKEFLQNQ